MQIVRGRAPDTTPTRNRTETFTGTVWGDPVPPTTAEHDTVNPATITTGTRTYRHHPTRGRLLDLAAGTGWVCPRGERQGVVRAGDLVWVPPGEQHRHGGTAETVPTHLAFSVGPTSRLEEVTEADYLVGQEVAR
ncbi:cupin domain-containing protein [Pseudonocardia kujensis]|uniref:cupin domain-containing protein n=1 Tax=Pseudonocardia kujensis TaxID=1128675 RepID=UPI001E3545FD|nr:cupin domain-containing protein [Pseudonocardia kujensis]MCE0762778.1 cupin domain-containing protein [Pseudonocardia kujensis]